MIEPVLVRRSPADDVTADRIQRVLPGESYCELVRAVLESGGSVWLSSSGYSMMPTIRDGDEVLVRPATVGDVRHGRIVLRGAGRGFVLHRVVDISRHSVVTRGDNAAGPDAPAPLDHVIGIATAVRRSGRVRAVELSMRHGFLAMLLHLESAARRRAHGLLRRQRVSPVRPAAVSDRGRQS